MVSAVGGGGDVDIIFTVTNATGPGLASVQNSVNTAATNVSNTVGSRFQTINDAVKGVEESFRRLGNTLVGAGGALTGTFTLPLVLGLKNLTTAGTEFETELYRVVSLFADAQHPVEMLTRDFQEFAQSMAIKSKFSGTEVLQTMYLMGQAGYDVEQIYASLGAVLELATAQNYDLSKTFGVVNTVLKSYNIDAADATEVTNMLAAAASAFNLSMDDYVNGLKYVLPTAKSLNMDLSEMLVMMGALTDRGFKGQQAGRILRDSFSDLIAPVDSTRAILEKYNLELYTNQDAINGAARAYNAAANKLDMMERGTLGSKDELAALQAQIGQNNALMERANLSGNIKDAKDLALANQQLKETYAYLNGTEKINNAAIAQQRQVVEDLGAELDSITVEGLIPYHEMIKQIAESGMSASEIYTMFGKQSGGAIIALTDIYKNNQDYFESMMTEVETKLAAQEQAAVQMQSTAFQVKQLQEAMNQLRIEGYMALAPVIKELNKWLLDNMDTLKELVRMVIEGLLPPLQRFLGLAQGMIDWFDGLSTGTKKMIIGLTMGAAVLLAVLGPILLYTGAIAWATASVLKLGRGFATVMYDGYLFVKAVSAVGVSSALSATSVGGLGTAIGVTGTEAGLSVAPSIAASQGYTIVGVGAAEATPLVAGLGTTIMTIIPWLAVLGIAAYILYAAYKTNFNGMKDAVHVTGEAMQGDIDNVIRPALKRLKAEVGQMGEGGSEILKGLVDVDPYQITYGVAKLLGAIGGAFRDLDIVMRGIGHGIVMGIVAGMTGGDAGAAFEKEMENVISISKIGEAAVKGWVEGQTGGAKTYDTALRQVVMTQREMDAIHASHADYVESINATANATSKSTNKEKSYGMEIANSTSLLDNFNTTVNNGAAAKMTFNNTPLQMATSAGNFSVVGIIPVKTAEKAGNKAGEAAKEGTVDAYEDVTDKIAAALENKDFTALNELISGDNADILKDGAYQLGLDVGDELGDGVNTSYLEALIQLANAQQDFGAGLTLPTYDTTGVAKKLYTWKEAYIGGLQEINGQLYTMQQINTAAASAKSYDDYPSLNELMKTQTPVGMYAARAAEQKVTAAPNLDAASLAKAGSDYLTSAVATPASAAAAAAGQTNIQNYFAITTNVYPKQEMDAAEISAIGDKITSIVEEKLGEKHSANEVV